MLTFRAQVVLTRDFPWRTAEVRAGVSAADEATANIYHLTIVSLSA